MERAFGRFSSTVLRNHACGTRLQIFTALLQLAIAACLRSGPIPLIFVMLHAPSLTVKHASSGLLRLPRATSDHGLLQLRTVQRCFTQRASFSSLYMRAQLHQAGREVALRTPSPIFFAHARPSDNTEWHCALARSTAELVGGASHAAAAARDGSVGLICLLAWLANLQRSSKCTICSVHVVALLTTCGSSEAIAAAQAFGLEGPVRWV